MTQRSMSERSMSERSISERSRVRTGLMVAAAAAVLTLAPPVVAQVPSPGQNQVETSPDTVNLTMEQRHIVKEIILKDLEVQPLQDQAAQVPLTVGAVVPSGIPLQPMPVEVAAKVPQLKTHSFLVKDDKVVIIDPKDNKVSALVQ